MDKNVFVQYKTDEEQMSAFRKMLGLRHEFETRVNQIIAQRQHMQLAK